MSINVYTKGQTVRWRAEFENAAGTLTDPTTVTFKLRSPAGTTTTYTYALAEVTKESTGVFYKDVTLTESGPWHSRWEGTGAVQAVKESQLEVAPSAF